MNPPTVWLLTTPSNHRTNRITKIVQSISSSSFCQPRPQVAFITKAIAVELSNEHAVEVSRFFWEFRRNDCSSAYENMSGADLEPYSRSLDFTNLFWTSHIRRC